MSAIGFHVDRASVHWGRFSLVPARSATEYAGAASLRQRLFFERRRLSLDADYETQRDDAGQIFLLREAEKLVGTARVSPFPSSLSPLPAALAAELSADSELNRLACVRAGRDCKTRYSALLLTLGARYLLTHTGLRRYVARAHPRLSISYQRLGAVDTGRRCLLPHCGEPYHVLVGSYAEALHRGSALYGLDDPERERSK